MSENIIVRNAGPEDIEDMALLMTQLGYPTSPREMRIRFESIASHPDYCTLIARAGDEIVGLAGLVKGLYYEYNGEYLRILAFVVKESGRKRGIGRVLLKACEQWGVSQGLNVAVLNSGNRAAREAAHAFYQKMGYKIKSSGFIKQL
ncbi:MAG TPA: GNAT family N-acetyltransferase [Mucilaginibacter sp.]|jgi:GNAT superfamily N-acetyltransferase|nr:GNAT family N-acetyltransferase [Mucilaginibacter sp.]